MGSTTGGRVAGFRIARARPRDKTRPSKIVNAEILPSDPGAGSAGPGLILHTSNRLERLADRLADVMRAAPAGPFESEVVIVQSQGMARWLQLELARRLGLCANVRFPFPRAFALEVFEAFDPDPPHPDGDPELRADPGQLTWQIWGLLPWLARQPGAESIAHYLEHDADGRKRHQLAWRIARLFDDYAIFRPDLVLAWDAGRPGPDPRHPWQAQLWRQLGEIAGPHHAARRRERFLEHVRQTTRRPANLPRRASLFGISSLPPFHVDVFEHLAPWCSVHGFLLQPAAEYWGDQTSAQASLRRARRVPESTPAASELHRHEGNPLLASLGGQGRDFLNVLLAQTEFNNFDDFAEPGDDTLLHSLQSDILKLRAPDGTRRLRPDDDSVMIHSCHSPLRELEVLQDQLLDWFARDPSLTPRDILVMTPDIETYAPLIDAVFAGPADAGDLAAGAGGGQRSVPVIPFSVADRASGSQSQIVGTFVRILGLAGSRLGAASVIELLETPAVRRRFGLTEAEVALAREWLRDAGVRWARDEAHRQALKLPALRQNTWAEGLDRLLLGYAMHGRPAQLFQGLLPCDAVEGQSSNILGRVLEFVGRLFATVETLEQPHPLADWVGILRQLVADFFAESEADEPDLRLLRRLLSQLAPPAGAPPVAEPMPLAVVLEHLGPALADDRIRGGFLTGRVTFGALKPMRSIPFRIICLLGLNDSAFPRSDPRLGFDLMAESPRLGDQSKREDDRYLFLETLLSARDRLHLSYVGQSIRDNSVAPPSVLVSELLDYIDQGCQPPDENAAGVRSERPRPSRQILRRHRLQAFSAEYFKPGTELFSYSEENLRAGEALRQPGPLPPFVAGSLPEPDPAWRTIALDDLAGFFGHPARFFLRHRLDLRRPESATELPEREPMDLEGLERFQFKSELLTRRLSGEDLPSLQPVFLASGRLPLGRQGELMYRELAGSVEALAASLAPFQPNHRIPAPELDLSLDDFRITGRFEHVTPAGLLQYRPGKLQPKLRVQAWVCHLAWCALAPSGLPHASVLVGEHGTDDVPTALRFKPVEAATARALLQTLLKLYWGGLAKPLPFFPQASLEFAQAERPDADNADANADPARRECRALEKAQIAWEGSDYRRGESLDPDFQICFRGRDPIDAEFIAVARAVGAPLLEQEERL